MAIVIIFQYSHCNNMHHIIACHCSVHDVASSSEIHKLIIGYAFEYNFWLSLVPLIYLVAADTIGLLFLFSCGGVLVT